MLTDTKKFALPVLTIVFFALALYVQSCKRSRSDMAKTLFTRTKNKVYKDVTPEGFAEVFQKILDSEKTTLQNVNVIAGYYDNNDHAPTFVMDHLFNGDLESTVGYYEKS